LLRSRSSVSGTSVRGAYTVVVEMMVVATMLPFVPLFGPRSSCPQTPRCLGRSGFPADGPTVVVMALIGLATTLGAIALAFVPPADEERPAIAVLKVAGMTTTLLLAGAAVYFRGKRPRAAARTPGGRSAPVGAVSSL